ncbi:flagellin [Natronogracilivirga saccharolytica]|uniref:Flagellin n=1 Tax=Natronogracilivirga saccharolytica TaxID=2812953 RepID=A0A8J7S860_9BACT|nr:flagellin [Natronogracilivirga saccharolytica]MBP3191981.1 flagellin [Natronogracilivirga saccharolytica]
MSSFGDLNRVNTNIQSLDSQLSLNRINRDMADNQLRMSTGLRINRAEDDAAGYSIATKLDSRVEGLEQALQNVGDAKSVLDITESSFDTIMDNLIEMKGLATQAANDTLGDQEREYIGEQISALGNDINEIANQTVFQDFQLLNGDLDTDGDPTLSGTFGLTFQVGERAQDTLDTGIEAVNVAALFDAQGGDPVEGVTAGGAEDIANIRVEGTVADGAQGELVFNDGADPAVAATAEDFRHFIGAIDNAIDSMADRVNEVGVAQSSLSVREVTLSESVSANESASSRIMDTDFAKEQSESVRLQILQQTATSALAQANQGPQSVLGFLG